MAKSTTTESHRLCCWDFKVKSFHEKAGVSQVCFFFLAAALFRLSRAASTSKKRNNELPCLLMCPKRARSSPNYPRSGAAAGTEL